MPPRLRPVRQAPPADAFEREFGDREGPRPYCGAKHPPRGRTMGSPNYCFKSGLKSGFAAAAQRAVAPAAAVVGPTRNERTRRNALIEGALTERQKIMEAIKTKGFSALKRMLHLDTLNQRELGGIAVREHARQPFVPHYSSYSKAQLVQALVQRGYKR
jgi:hypothetical protein